MAKKTINKIIDNNLKQSKLKAIESQVKTVLKRIIKEEVSKVLREKGEEDWQEPKGGHPESYYISYYSTVGEHGEAGTFRDFNTAYKTAIQKTRQKNSEGESFMDGLEYLGVEGTWESSQFAIIFITKSYLKRISQNYFNNPNDYKTFLNAANKCLQTGKPVKGIYSEK